jgi:deazaflavin-dependent oxidoreductase (nitroreductase family)
MGAFLKRLLALVFGLALTDAAFAWLIRHDWARGPMRSFNRRILNPVMLRRAGEGTWYASVIEHSGRKSGRHYLTPVVADPVTDGFLIPLPYGEHVDWLENIKATGEATIRRHGVSYPVSEIEVISDLDAAPLIDPAHLRSFRFHGIERYVRAHTAGVELVNV